MQVMLRTPVPFSQLHPGDTFGCSVRSAPYLMLKDMRGLAVVLQNGEICEIHPDESCIPIVGVFMEGGAIFGSARQGAAYKQDPAGNVTAEIRGTVGPQPT
jgi:hypothetical protein